MLETLDIKSAIFAHYLHNSWGKPLARCEPALPGAKCIATNHRDNKPSGRTTKCDNELEQINCQDAPSNSILGIDSKINIIAKVKV